MRTTRDNNSMEDQEEIIFADTFSGKVPSNNRIRQVSWLVTADLPSHPFCGGTMEYDGSAMGYLQLPDSP